LNCALRSLCFKEEILAFQGTRKGKEHDPVKLSEATIEGAPGRGERAGKQDDWERGLHRGGAFIRFQRRHAYRRIPQKNKAAGISRKHQRKKDGGDLSSPLLCRGGATALLVGHPRRRPFKTSPWCSVSGEKGGIHPKKSILSTAGRPAWLFAFVGLERPRTAGRRNRNGRYTSGVGPKILERFRLCVGSLKTLERSCSG